MPEAVGFAVVGPGTGLVFAGMPQRAKKPLLTVAERMPIVEGLYPCPLGPDEDA